MKNTALVIFLDSKGLVLLQQKTYDAPNFPGVWSLFGGAIEEGETALEAVKRETAEELGVQFSVTDFTSFKEFKDGERTRFVFIARVNDDVVLSLREGRGLGYFNKKEIEYLEIPAHIRAILSVYFA